MKIQNAKFEYYPRPYLIEKHKPPSRGGNSGSLHQHVLIIEGERYSFVKVGWKQAVFESDTVSFEWDWDKSGKYRNINTATMRVYDKNGKRVVRG